ncbi:signal transduction histidine kinase [Rhodoligotrophos appendicifer]|uniref:ATP-binding protein n=1 Tax=Rhodoligotrophos appendicifer TaxID=987056 RepID=UPI001FE9F30A|nr:ATP-binding protein [Rhodoligotrophos appendicifer]
MALLLVVAIISVVALASLAAISVLREPAIGQTITPIAQQLALQIDLLSGSDPATVDRHLMNHKALGEVDEWTTQVISRALRAIGKTPQIFVTDDADLNHKQVSIRLDSGRWLVLGFPDFSPPSNTWYVFGGWISLIVAGAVAVSIFFATILTRPLEMIEAAVTWIGPDGMLEPLPEEGSGEIRATARALNQLSSRLKSAVESRMRLVAAAGHDLRTPMTRMRLRAEFLTESERENWLADLDELERIADSAIILVRENGRPSPWELLSLKTLLSELIDDLSHLNLPVSRGVLNEIFVEANKVGLNRALRNLVVNAATHGKRCEVHLREEEHSAVIEIKDFGPGIPADLIDKAFEPFFRVDPGRRQSVPGAGLGLAIAKEIIERLGGTIVLVNIAEGGLLQTIQLPSAPSREERRFQAA